MKKLLGRRQARRWFVALSVFLISFTASEAVRADQVRMRNGDSYFGNVVSLDNETLVLQSDVLGTLRLPRNKLVGVAFGVNAKTVAPVVVPAPNQPVPKPPLAATNEPSDIASAFRQLGANSNLVGQVQSQFLAGAGPEANAKFNQLLGGLASGKLNLNDLRAEAKSAADQVRAVRQDLGDDAGAMIDGYLAILDSFLKETAPSSGVASTNLPSLSVKPKTTSPEEE